MGKDVTSASDASPAGGTRRRGRTIALAVAVNALVLAIAIAGLELIGWCSVNLPTSHVVPSWRLNHTWRPSSKVKHPGWAKSDLRFPEPYTHVYNKQGWIETYDVEPHKPAGTYRVFYLGDSFVEGPMPMEQSLPSLVERQLNERARGKGVRFEVVNTGTSSYSPTIYYVLMRYVVADYEPDLVVVCVDMTDDYDDWKYSETAIPDDEGNPVAVPQRNLYTSAFIDTPQGAVRATLMARVELFLYRNSHFYNLIQSRRLGARAQETASSPPPAEDAVYPRWAWCQHQWDEQTRTNVGRTLDVLRRTAAFCKSKGIRLVLTSVPHHRQYAAGRRGGDPPLWSSRPHEEIARLAQAEGTPYLDAFERLAPHIRGTPQGKYYYNRDMHFNPTGSRLWARAHLDFLTDERRGLLPEAFWRD